MEKDTSYSSQEKSIKIGSILNIYTINTRAPIYVKEKLLFKSHTLIGGFNTHSPQLTGLPDRNLIEK